jgi:hypothetical protein
MLGASLGHVDLEVRVSFPVVGFIEPTRPEHGQLRPWSYDFQTERACNLHIAIISVFFPAEKGEFACFKIPLSTTFVRDFHRFQQE